MKSPEQDLLWYLGLFMVLQNDPLFIVTATQRIFIQMLLAQVINIIFSGILAYFWLCTIERMYNG